MGYSQYSQSTLLATYGSNAAAVQANLVAVALNLGANTISVRLHRLVASRFVQACSEYAALVKAGKASAYAFIPASCGTWNWRLKNLAGGKKGSTLSTHSFGIALDINSFNPNGQGAAAKSNIPVALVTCANRYGIYWGGNWSGSSRDPMHFEYAPASFGSVASAAPVSSSYPGYLIKRGIGSVSRPDANVKKVQTKVGFTAKDVDGAFGPKTYTKVCAWQRSHALRDDGIVGPLTWKAMFG